MASKPLSKHAKEDWHFLTVIIDLSSRQIIVWSMGGSITGLVLNAITMACWRRNPQDEFIELFYNSARHHGNNNLSSMEYEKNYFLKQSSV